MAAPAGVPTGRPWLPVTSLVERAGGERLQSLGLRGGPADGGLDAVEGGDALVFQRASTRRWLASWIWVWSWARLRSTSAWAEAGIAGS
ncbi:hypothetical protein ACM01_12025 [Streptomyces viridochromogenes]|uniref:Uncharacterized protein n=1 Tax=Streptomyces viridochromogenes TaxID=1938 RepID=A0A0J7ZIR2_STRVR|nr:hypothetical protein ACM01_12025 [Streptomyces viridochromogenes]